MVFKEVSFYNFRIYKGTNIIYLSPEGDQNISVISGLNGYGKTTFLMGLVWCLYGRQMDQVDEFYKKEIRGYEGYDKYIGNSLNRLADKEGDTKFSVSIIISDINIPEIPCQEIKITRTYDNVTGNSDQVEILIDGCESELVRDLGDEKLTSEEIFIRDFILPIEIAKFFFFDAEKIISLAEVTTKNQRRNLNMAYSEVLGIKKYEDLKAELEELRLKLKQESASTMGKIELETLTQKKNTFEIQIQECEDVILDKLEEKDGLQNDSNQIQEKLIRQGNQISVQQLEELRAKASDFKSKIKDLHDQLKKSYEIIPFAIAGD